MLDSRLHNMFKIFFSILFLLCFSLANAETINISWTQDKTTGIFSFANESRLEDYKTLPFYCYTKVFNKKIKGFDYTLEVIETKELSKEEIVYFSLGTPSEKRIEKKEISIARNEGVASVLFSAIYKNSNNQWVKIIKAEIEINSVIFEESSFAKASPYKNGNSSVLSNGRWYKMSITNTGIYKIDKKFLQSMGINPTEVNPKNIRIYGSGGMLPEQVSKQKYFDLPELAIYVEGENDGVFNDNDYILFYAVGPHTWSYDNSKQTYRHQSHYFADASHYFLSFDLGSGKRIGTQAEDIGTPTDSVSTFDDYAFYEKDEVNLNKTGRIWFEKPLSISTTEKNYSFNFVNADLNTPMELNVEFATRSTQKSGNTVSFLLNNSTNVKTFTNLNAIIANSEGDYADPTTSWKNNFSPSSSSFNITMKYALPLNEAECWLNYIEVIAKKNLVLSSTPTLFRNVSTVKANGITKYKIAGVNSSTKIWDVTNPFNVLEQQFTVNGSNASFIQKADTLKEYALFSSQSFSTPSFVAQISNQDIHSAFPIDYVIVAPSEFLSAANMLADYHKSNSGLSVLVVTPEQVYNEFSSGTKDISAIRNMMRYFYSSATSNNELPKYLLLFGDASYDYKARTGLGGDYVPTFESYEYLSITDSYASDDYFGYLDNNEGVSSSDKVDIGIGRIPVSSASQATAIAKKIIDYASSGTQITSEYPSVTPTLKSGFGDWRNKIVFIGDDGSDPHQYVDYMEHVNGGESSSNKVKNLDSNLNHQKIYFDAYKKEFSAAGGRYPEVEKAIAEVMNNGALIVHYIGHGGEAGWADERVLTIPNINQWNNYNTLPFFVTATCEFSRFDDPQRISGGELAFLNEKGGVMGQLTTSRLVYGNSNLNMTGKFYDSLLANNAITKPTLGTAIMKAKQTAGPGTFNNNRKFYLMGDPAMKLAFPENKIVLNKINQVAVNSGKDTIKALMKVTVEGEIQNQGNQLLSSYNGVLYTTIYDKKQSTKTSNNINKDSVPYSFQNSVLYKGKASIVNGIFSFEFIAPKDINYSFGNGRISLYAANQNEDAAGYYEGVTIGGNSNAGITDNKGPEIRLFMNDSSFVYGGLTDENPKIYALIYDESGINTTGNAIGHDLQAILDNISTKPYNLNSSYEADINSYQRGKVQYQLSDLTEGTHQLSLKVWDVNNNSSTAATEFVVSNSAQLALSHVLNYPNPFTTSTQFWFEHNYASGMLEVQIQIMNINGKVVKTINTTIDGSDRYKPTPILWDGNDDYGDAIGRGVYIYKLKVKTDNGMFAEKMEKLVILK